MFVFFKKETPYSPQQDDRLFNSAKILGKVIFQFMPASPTQHIQFPFNRNWVSFPSLSFDLASIYMWYFPFKPIITVIYICIYLFKSFILGSDVYSVNVETWLWRFIITLLILFLNCAVVLYIVFLLCVFYILNFRTVVGNKWLWISCTFSPLLFSTVLNYTFEGDAERRKERLPPRIDFLGPSGGQVELKGQRREACTDTKLRLLVKLVSSISSRTVLSICSNP